MTLHPAILKASATVQPPLAKAVPHRLEKHGDVRIDPYFWLKERENQKVLDYLHSENAYSEVILRPTLPFQEDLFYEMKRRIKEEDTSAPEKDRDYYYYRRFEKGKEYPIFCRKRETLNASEEIYLDANGLAKGHAFFSIGGLAISLDQQWLAYAVDIVGRRIHTLFFKNLRTGATLEDRIEEVTANMVWANDNQTLLYAKQNVETLRSDRIFRHQLGNPSDTLIYEDRDETFDVHVYKTSSNRLLVIGSSSTVTSEARYLDANTPEGEFKIFQPRVRGHEYTLDEAGDRFLILTNDEAKNFKLMEASFENHAKENWKEVIPHQENVLLEGFRPFKTHLVLQERRNGLTQLHILDRTSGQGHYLEFREPVYLAEIGKNREFESPWLRFEYESMTCPGSVYDYEFGTGKQLLRKELEIPGYSAELYESRRLFAKAEDGTEIPLSVVYRKDTVKSPQTPCVIYGYGSYGLSLDPHFSTDRLTLLDRGFIFAMAHVRGGSEMGRHWYEDGRQLKKRNSFSDFIACTEFLIQEKWTSPPHLYAMGGSAGGLLMGTVMNWRPDLYHGVVAAVPFVDVVTTMLDDTIPLTTGEYDEWGNPNEKTYYDYIRSYSPYDNLKAQPYPHLLITTGLHDSQVQYWEPAKWVAKLRTLNQGKRLLLLWTEMDAGHGGKTGRYDRLHDQVRVYAFFLGLEGILT